LKTSKGAIRSHKSKKDRQHNEALDNSKHHINEILSGVKIPVTLLRYSKEIVIKFGFEFYMKSF
jgi:hypothetical protein